MLKADWQAIAEEYITGEISMRSLAVKYALPRSTLRSRQIRRRKKRLFRLNGRCMRARSSA